MINLEIRPNSYLSESWQKPTRIERPTFILTSDFARQAPLKIITKFSIFTVHPRKVCYIPPYEKTATIFHYMLKTKSQISSTSNYHHTKDAKYS